jgi:hypothetical protein
MRSISAWMVAGIVALGAAAYATAPTGPKVGDAPPEVSVTNWLNSSGPLTLKAMKGRVVLLEFWSPG